MAKGAIHNGVRETLQALPKLALQKVLEKKLKHAGVRAYKKVAEGLADHLLKGSNEPFTWGRGERAKLVSIEFDEQDALELQKISDQLRDGAPRLVQRVMETFSRELASHLLDEWKQHRYLEERMLRSFKDRLEDTWGDGLDALRCTLEYCRQRGEEAAGRTIQSRARVGRIRNEALIALHLRACQVATEIVALLECGLADGAMARWRTLHEVTIVALIISDGDDQLAERYIEHSAVEKKKGLDRFLLDHKTLGFRAPSKRDVMNTNRAYDRVLKKYGGTFKTEFGWAAERLGLARPRFIDLQDAAGRSASHSDYKFASHSVHASSMALTTRISNLYADDPPIAGASNAGIEEPGIRAVNSLSLITHVLPGGKFKMDNTVTDMVLLELRDTTVEKLMQADRALRRLDRDIRQAIDGAEASPF